MKWSGAVLIKNPMSAMVCTGATFVKKNFCLVARNSSILYCSSASA